LAFIANRIMQLILGSNETLVRVCCPFQVKTSNNDSDNDEVQFNETVDDKRIPATVIHFDAGAKVSIEMRESVIPIRPHILACIVRGLDLKRTANTYKRFITAQNKLHDSICDKRQASTLAVHDMVAISAPLIFEGRPSGNFELTPLNDSTPMSAKELVETLCREAEEFRKLKKRSCFSGLHKYLELVKDAENFACICDSQGTVISFPPITNAAKTKISASTRDVLLEVTSSTSLDACRKAMFALINEVLELVTNPAGSKPEITFEQVRVVDSAGKLRSVFPSLTDFRDDARLNVSFVYPPEPKKGG